MRLLPSLNDPCRGLKDAVIVGTVIGGVVGGVQAAAQERHNNTKKADQIGKGVNDKSAQLPQEDGNFNTKNTQRDVHLPSVLITEEMEVGKIQRNEVCNEKAPYPSYDKKQPVIGMKTDNPMKIFGSKTKKLMDER